MQIYADVTGREIKVSASKQAPALGSAMYGAVAAGAAAGGYDSIFEAAGKMAHLKDGDLQAGSRAPEGVRPALCRICPAVRLLRPRREQCDEDAQAHSQRGNQGGLTADLREGADAGRITCRRCAAGTKALPDRRTGGLDQRQRQRARPGDRAGGDQAQRRALRRSARPKTWWWSTWRASGVEGRLKPSVDTATHLYVYRAPAGRGRHRAHAFDLRHGLCGGGQADPAVLDRHLRRVRRADPGGRLCPHRRRGDRPGDRALDRRSARPS